MRHAVQFAGDERHQKRFIVLLSQSQPAMGDWSLTRLTAMAATMPLLMPLRSRPNRYPYLPVKATH